MRSCWLRSVTWVQKASTLHPSSSMRLMISPRPLRSCFWSSTCVKMLASSWQVLRSQLIWFVPSWMPWRLIFRNYHLSFLQTSTHQDPLMKQLHSWGVELQLDAKCVLFTRSSRCWTVSLRESALVWQEVEDSPWPRRGACWCSRQGGCGRSQQDRQRYFTWEDKMDASSSHCTNYADDPHVGKSCRQRTTCPWVLYPWDPLGTWSKVRNIYFSNGLKPPTRNFWKDDCKSILLSRGMNVKFLASTWQT